MMTMEEDGDDDNDAFFVMERGKDGANGRGAGSRMTNDMAIATSVDMRLRYHSSNWGEGKGAMDNDP
jgi:hypothetical protein